MKTDDLAFFTAIKISSRDRSIQKTSGIKRTEKKKHFSKKIYDDRKSTKIGSGTITCSCDRVDSLVDI